MTATTPFLSRALRGSAIMAGSTALSQGLRLASNLILTRLLFPEAFGLMALVSIFLVGLAMFSDAGIAPAIARSPRGDEDAFLDTAWTFNAIRGVVLWLMTCILAVPVAALYEAPDLRVLLPAAGVTLAIAGLSPTRIDTANRHLLLGRVTVLDLISQVIGIAGMIVLAWLTRSVSALVAGAVIGAVARLVLMHLCLPGRGNRPLWEPAAAAELLHFGKWIFLSTACGFLLLQGDKAILGAYLTLEQLGVYNIGFFLASFPMLLGGAVASKVLIPIYRNLTEDQHARLRRMRTGLTAAMLGLLIVMALLGPVAIGLLYDMRYAGAAGIVVAVSLVQMPFAIGMTYDHAALAAGDSKGFFRVVALRAGVQTVCFLLGAEVLGLPGALLGQGLAAIATYPLTIGLARRHGVWDGRHDAWFWLCAGLGCVVSVWLNAHLLRALVH